MNGEFASTQPPPPERYRNVEPLAASPAQVRRAVNRLLAAEHPMIHAGSGVLHARASAELQELAAVLRSPVTTSWAGRDAIRETSRFSIPMSYIELNNRVRNEADLVLALGTRFGETDWWGKPPYWRSPQEQELIQVDLDEEVLGQNKPVDLAIVADARNFLTLLLAELKEQGESAHVAAREAKIAEYAEAKQAARRELDEMLAKETELVHSSRVASICREIFADDAILVADGGNTAIWANLYHEIREPHTLLSTYKFGMLGAGVAQALGAKAACPERQVYCIIGDGAMGFHPQEVETAVRNDLAVVFLVLCDRQWGMVKVNQEFAIDPKRTLTEGGLGPGETINTDLGEIRFDLLAESMGAHGERVRTAAELEPALERSLASGRCAVIHVDVDPVAHKFAPNLAVFKEMHAEPAG
jgi:acetolactate synthase-1/2/3 large subunit